MFLEHLRHALTMCSTFQAHFTDEEAETLRGEGNSVANIT